MKKICVLTTSRADYSHLYWPMRRIQDHPSLSLKLLVSGAHLSPEFGLTVRTIVDDGFTVDDEFECLISSDSDVGMAKTIGLATLSLADLLGRMRPDVLLLIADRYEMLAPASVATALRIPIAHIEGGEVSEGAIDDAIRNALTKLAHVHFTPTEQASAEVEAMGETPWRIHCTGAPSLDHLRFSEIPGRQDLEAALDRPLDAAAGLTVVAYHPVTLLEDTTTEAEGLFEALRDVPGDIVFCWPNADTGSRKLMHRAQAFCAARRNASVHVNLESTLYWGLLREARMLVGNSSSGIMETASLALPTVNVGFRQAGRLRAKNVIDAAPDRNAIKEAITRASDPVFQDSLKAMTNPYGDGNAGTKMAEILAGLPDAETLLRKRS